VGAATHSGRELSADARAIVDALPVAAVVGSSVRDDAGRIVGLSTDHVNPLAERATGAVSFGGPELFDRVVRVIESDRPVSCEVETPAGVFAVDVSRRGDGYVGLFRDVTDERRAADRLRANEARLAEAQRIARIGVWEWDMASGEVTWSDELFNIYGVSPGTYRPSYEGYLSRVHPEDRERVAAVIAAAARDGRPFAFDERVVRPDGSVRTLHSGGHVAVDEQDRPATMIGVCHDVTGRAV
jgi:PAS domain-containing protein